MTTTTERTVAEFGDQRLPAHFWAKVAVNEETGCWEWTAGRISNGYGSLRIKGRAQLAHRVAYAAIVGDLPPYTFGGLQLDHLCSVRACVNPAHLELVTPRVNVLRGEAPTAKNARRTRCPQGHSLEGDNLVGGWLARGYRGCLDCARAAARAQYATTRGAEVALGLTRAEYRAAFGQSTATAERILAAVESGIAPEVIVANARKDA